MSKAFFRRIILGLKARGCRQDPVTGQSVQFAKHSGDIAYDLVGDTAIAKKSEFIELTRERILNPNTSKNLNKVGQDKNIIKRTAKKRYVKLD